MHSTFSGQRDLILVFDSIVSVDELCFLEIRSLLCYKPSETPLRFPPESVEQWIERQEEFDNYIWSVVGNKLLFGCEDNWAGEWREAMGTSEQNHPMSNGKQPDDTAERSAMFTVCNIQQHYAVLEGATWIDAEKLC